MIKLTKKKDRSAKKRRESKSSSHDESLDSFVLIEKVFIQPTTTNDNDSTFTEIQKGQTTETSHRWTSNIFFFRRSNGMFSTYRFEYSSNIEKFIETRSFAIGKMFVELRFSIRFRFSLGSNSLFRKRFNSVFHRTCRFDLFAQFGQRIRSNDSPRCLSIFEFNFEKSRSKNFVVRFLFDIRFSFRFDARRRTLHSSWKSSFEFSSAVDSTFGFFAKTLKIKRKLLCNFILVASNPFGNKEKNSKFSGKTIFFPHFRWTHRRHSNHFYY